MTWPITQPGYYRLSAKGLKRVSGLDNPPDDITDLVRIEYDQPMTEESLFPADEPKGH